MNCGLGFNPKTKKFKVLWVIIHGETYEAEASSTLGTGIWRSILIVNLLTDIHVVFLLIFMLLLMDLFILLLVGKVSKYSHLVSKVNNFYRSFSSYLSYLGEQWLDIGVFRDMLYIFLFCKQLFQNGLHRGMADGGVRRC